MKFFNIVISVMSLSLLTGCSSIYQQPGTELLAPHEKAVIHAKWMSSEVLICEIDGVQKKTGLFDSYEVLPGERVLSTKYYDGMYASGLYKVKFTAIANHEYQLKVLANRKQRKWMPIIVDNATQEVVSEPIMDQY